MSVNDNIQIPSGKNTNHFVTDAYAESSDDQTDSERKIFDPAGEHTYRRTPMPKCDFNKVAKQLY